MDDISQHICYLLRHHDCVVLPGWGAFVARRCPAVIDQEAGRVCPPRRVLGFNAAITHDDGLIASSVSRRDGIGYDMALQRVNESVDMLRRRIASDRELFMDGIGSFTLNGEDALVFEPYDRNVVSLPLLSLPDIPLVPVLEAARLQSGSESGEAMYLPFSRNWLKIVASLLILIGLGFVLSTPIAIPEAARASLAAPAITFSTQQDDEVFELSEANRHGVLSIVIPQGDEAASVVDTVTVVAPVPAVPASVRMNEYDRYCVVVASLASRELAREFIEKADIPMDILEKDGKYRVYAATGNTSSQAKASAQQAHIYDRYPGVWVCRR